MFRKQSKSAAIKDGIVPKARKGFQIFMKSLKSTVVGQGQFFAVAKDKWAMLPAAEKLHYNTLSKAEFDTQRLAWNALQQDARLSRRPKSHGGQTPAAVGGNTCFRPVGRSERGRQSSCDGQSVVMNSVIRVGPWVFDGNSICLGRGAYGSVFRAVHETHMWFGAVKLFGDKRSLNDELDMYKLLAEGCTEGFFPRLHASSDGAGLAQGALVMEIFEVSASAWLRSTSHSRTMPTALAFADQIAAAISFMHDNCVFHMDIKPSNVLLNLAERRAVVCDFSISEIVGELPRSKQYTTAGYRAPELWATDSIGRCPAAAVCFPADRWSYGVVLWELLVHCPADQHGYRPLFYSADQHVDKYITIAISSYCAEMRLPAARRVLSSHWQRSLSLAGQWANRVASFLEPDPARRSRFGVRLSC